MTGITRPAIPPGCHPARGAGGRLPLVLPALLCLLGCLLAGPLRAQGPTERYDQTFRKYSKRFFGAGYDWRVFKAQGLTESNLDTAATSWVGARGIMQLMPSTFGEIQSANPELVSVDDAEWNIAAGIFYDRRLWRQWSDAVAAEDRRHFMFGSYNAGRVPLLRAQELAQSRALDPRVWENIAAVAAEVPRWRHRETLTYVERIEENLERMDTRGRVVRHPRTIP